MSRYILMLVVLFSAFPFVLKGQTQPKELVEKALEKKEPVRFYQGLSVGTEVSGLVGQLLGNDMVNYEVQLQANLLNRFLPVVEVGYGKVESINDGTNNAYHTAAPYFRVGMDYNFMHKKPHLPGYLYGGVRFGASRFNFDVSAPRMTDPNYGGLNSVDFNYKGLQNSAMWAEALVGIKVNIYKRFHMGWCIRYKVRLKQTKNENASAWYVPGFGTNQSTGMFFTYNVIYNLPF